MIFLLGLIVFGGAIKGHTRIVVENYTDVDTFRASFTIFENLHLCCMGEQPLRGSAIYISGPDGLDFYSNFNHFVNCSILERNGNGGAMCIWYANGTATLFRNCGDHCCSYFGSFSTFSEKSNFSINETSIQFCGQPEIAFQSSISLNRATFTLNSCNSSGNSVNSAASGFGSQLTVDSVCLYSTFFMNKGTTVINMNTDSPYVGYCNIVNNTITENIVYQREFSGFHLDHCTIVGNTCPSGGEFYSPGEIEVSDCDFDWISPEFSLVFNKHLNTGECAAEFPYATDIFTDDYKSWNKNPLLSIQLSFGMFHYWTSIVYQ